MIGGMAALLAMSNALVYVVQREAMNRRFNQGLEQGVHAMIPLVSNDERGVRFDRDALTHLAAFRRGRTSDVFQVWLNDGTTVARSEALNEQGLPHSTEAFQDVRILKVQLPRGEEGRMAEVQVLVKGAGPPMWRPPTRMVHLAVARSTDELEAGLRFLAWLLLGTSAGVVGMSSLVGMVIVGRGLAPLKPLATRIAAIGKDSLKTHLAGDAVPMEMLPVVHQLNEMLERLEEAFERERCFTADAAHEFRTPLAGMRSIGEVALQRVRESGEYEKALRDMLRIARSMQQSAEALLMLARLDAGQVMPRKRTVALRPLIESVWEQFAEAAKRKRLVATNELPAEVTCEADPELLQLVLTNLAANAVEYTNDGGRIHIEGRRLDETTELAMGNTGCALGPDEVRHVFDRFWRGDGSRTGTGEHVGLGLSLVQRAVALTGGRVSATVESPDVFRIHIVLPRGSAET
jgi:signal transduction histidine kinase